MMTRILCLLFFVNVLFTNPLPAQTAPSSTTNQDEPASRTITPRGIGGKDSSSESSSSPMGRSVGTSIAALGAILLLFLGLVQIWRRYSPQASNSLPDSAWQMLGTAPLDQKHNLMIVRVGSRLLVLGQSEQGLQTLSEITGGDEVAQMMTICQQTPDAAEQASFSQLVKNFRNRSTSPPPSSSVEEARRA